MRGGSQIWKSFLIVAFLFRMQLPCCAQSQGATPGQAPSQSAAQAPSSNGIFVGEPKVYDDRSLQLLLNNLKTRLAQLSGLDQTSLISHLGGIQGASATTTGFSMQANGNPLPGTTTTATQPSPTTTQTTGGSTTTTPSSSGTTTTVTAPTGTTTTTTTSSSTATTNTASNQSVVSSPGSTLQTVTAAPAVTPAPPSIANVPSFALPSAFSPSSLDVLGEQMQLSYEIINLQLLLEGSLNDQYVRGTYLMKQRSTIGFPISITVPTTGDYRNAVAEVEVTVCDPPVVDATSEPPSLMTVLPREKTYNVASIVNKSVSLGASGVVAGVLSVGANFLWGHQTYYVVEDQDTIAIQRPPRIGACSNFQRYNESGQLVDAGVSTPTIFAWQFRPVLGQKIVKQGLRQTFAQVSFPPGPRLACAGTVTVGTKWLKYDRKTGIAGGEISGSSNIQTWAIASFYPNSLVRGVATADNFDGSMTVTVSGEYIPGTRVRIGSTYLDESTPGFQNTSKYIRFIAPNQVVALNGASLVTRDGVEDDIFAPNPNTLATLPPCQPERPVAPDPPPTTQASAAPISPTPRPIVRLQTAAFTDLMGGPNRVDTPADETTKPSQINPTPFSDSLVQVTVPLKGLSVQRLGGPYPIVVLLGGKAFGLSDSPFTSVTGDAVTFVAPKDLVKNQRQLIIKRLFLGKQYSNTYNLAAPSEFAITGMSLLSSTKTETAFGIVGADLEGTTVLQPRGVTLTVTGDGTVAFITLTAKQLQGVKQLVLQHETDPPVFVAIPESPPTSTVSKPSLTTHTPISPGVGIKYTITGSLLDSVTAIRYLDKQLPFALSVDKKSITLTLPDEVTATVGIRSLVITYSDGTTKPYAVTVDNPKAK
jgi:hypothetical protein